MMEALIMAFALPAALVEALAEALVHALTGTACTTPMAMSCWTRILCHYKVLHPGLQVHGVPLSAPLQAF